MGKIQDIHAREIIASGGKPTLEVTITLENGVSADSSISYGTSTGSREAVILLDLDKSRFEGNGMLKACENVNTIFKKAMVGKLSENQIELDNLMIQLDGSVNKSSLGANAILGVSLALAEVTAKEQKKPLYKYLRESILPHFYSSPPSEYILPSPMMVSIEGGRHADNSTDIQEYCISIVNKSFSVKDKVRAGEEIYSRLGKILKSSGFSTNVGNEGAFAPNGIKSNELPLKYITEAIRQSGYQEGIDAGISVDAAASIFFIKELGMYRLKLENATYTADALIDIYVNWFNKYPIISLEDLLSEFDWNSWKKLLTKFPERLIIADDLTVTNTQIIAQAIKDNCANAVIIKPNQIGTLSETIQASAMASVAGWKTIASHRGGGESNDTSLVDIAVAINSAFIKVGPTRGERVAKYNRLMRIEEEIGK